MVGRVDDSWVGVSAEGGSHYDSPRCTMSETQLIKGHTPAAAVDANPNLPRHYSCCVCVSLYVQMCV